MSSLFELTNDMQALYELATDPEADPRVLEDTIEGVMGAIEVKAADYIAVIHQLEMEADKAKNIAKTFTAKATVRENSIARMKKSLLAAMDLLNKNELAAGDFTIKVQNNGGVAPLKIDNPERVPDSFTKVTIEPDNKKIREYLKEHDVDWAHIEPRGKHITIN